VKLSSQIANMWDGELTEIDLGSASLTTNIGVGSSVSTDNENTYESSDTETITSNANDILAAASAEGNTSEILDEAIS
jgi:phosphoheptose isomerase